MAVPACCERDDCPVAKTKKQFKLRKKLVLFYLPIFIIPIAVLGIYLSIALNRSNINQSLQIYRQSTNQLQRSIMNHIFFFTFAQKRVSV